MRFPRDRERVRASRRYRLRRREERNLEQGERRARTLGRVWENRHQARIAVPSFFTLMNLFCGFVSMVLASAGNLKMAAVLIVLAALFDTFDGIMARLANATSEFGLELDSLSDVVSFGAAPGFLAYHLWLDNLQITGVILAALPVLCGSVRLARYNVDNKLTALPYFKGLPIPAQAIILSAFCLLFMGQLEWFDRFEWNIGSFLVPLITVLSFLMVSTIPFDKIPRLDAKSLRAEKGKAILFASYLLGILVFKEIGLMVAMSLYILKGVVTAVASVFLEPVDPA